jgi:hypothetical protein
MFCDDEYDTDDTDEIMARKMGGVAPPVVYTSGCKRPAASAMADAPSCILSEDWMFSISSASREFRTSAGAPS